MAGIELILPDWPAPAQVRALASTRAAGTSKPPYDSLNLGDHVDDDPHCVRANRALLRHAAQLPEEPRWLRQVHGKVVLDAETAAGARAGDGAATGAPGIVCAVLTADCLPLLLCDRRGTRVAAIHGGWRGLAAGIVEAAVGDFGRAGIPPGDLLAWLGPAIGPAAYEVGDDVRAAFGSAGDGVAFRANAAGRWQCDLFQLARGRLEAAGVRSVSGGGHCTYRESARFFSYRRDGACGRQASLIWLASG